MHCALVENARQEEHKSRTVPTVGKIFRDLEPVSAGAHSTNASRFDKPASWRANILISINHFQDKQVPGYISLVAEGCTGIGMVILI